MKPIAGKHKAIITGARGTIGLALSKYLMAEGIDVIGISHADHGGVFGTLTKKYPTSKFVQGDILDKTLLMGVFKEACGDQSIISVFHLAGQSDAQLCQDDPVAAFEQNTVATANVLEACIKHPINRFVYSSSSYVYGDKYQQDIKEDFELHPAVIYSMSKVASEDIIKGYAERHQINCSILRIGNVYGPDLKPGTVIEKMVTQYRKKEEISLLNFAPIRDFIYIDDVVEAMSRLIKSNEPGCRVLNLSSGEGISMGELAQLFCETKGLPQKINLTGATPGQKLSRIVLDNEALKKSLQWSPAIKMREGLQRMFNTLDKMEQYVKT